MRLDIYHEIKKNARDLVQLIKTNPSGILLKRENEPDPEKIKLDIKYPSRVSKVFQPEKKKGICTLCSRRISYKKGQFLNNFPSIPLAFIIQNTFLSERDEYYHDARVNHEFINLVQNATRKNPKEFHIREALRCHFAREDTQNTEWISNCRTHLKKDIELFKIKGIVIMGNAASFFIPDKEKLIKTAFKTIDTFGIPALISHGPERITAMKEKGYSIESIQNSENQIVQSISDFTNKILTGINN